MGLFNKFFSNKRKRFDIIPRVGANDIKLGMLRSEFRQIFGAPSDVTEKSIFNFNDISIPVPAKDGYYENELQITFDDENRVDFIEFSGHNANQIEVQLNGVDVFNIPAPKLLEHISTSLQTEYDKEEEEMPYTFVFPSIDLGLWRQVIPALDENTSLISDDDEGKYFWTIGIGIEGYYKRE